MNHKFTKEELENYDLQNLERLSFKFDPNGFLSLEEEDKENTENYRNLLISNILKLQEE